MSKIALTGNASGTGTLTIAAPNTNSNISFNLPSTLGSAGASDFVTADASGNVGIGTSSPAQRLEVASATGGAVGLRYVGNSGYATLGTDGNNNILFSIGNPPAEVGRFNSGGTLILKGGSTSATGTGITFPATQSASTDANTLDDYEEGTWTPGFAFGGNAVGVTYTAGNSGIYTKIGRVVTVIANVALTSKGSSTGNATITGLPFTAATGAEPNYSAVSFGNVSFLTFVEVPVGTVGGGETVIYLREITSAGGGTALTNADFDNQTQTRITVSYFVS